MRIKPEMVRKLSFVNDLVLLFICLFISVFFRVFRWPKPLDCYRAEELRLTTIFTGVLHPIW